MFSNTPFLITTRHTVTKNTSHLVGTPGKPFSITKSCKECIGIIISQYIFIMSKRCIINMMQCVSGCDRLMVLQSQVHVKLLHLVSARNKE